MKIMKISQYMQKYPVTIDRVRTVRDALRMFLNLQISALLVTRKKKLVGIITQEDILQNLFPSLMEFMQDTSLMGKEQLLEENLVEILDKPVSEFMVKDVKTVTPSTPVMQAQSTMLINNFSHLPVVNKEKELIGIIAQGDIFRALVTSEIPFDTDEEYHDWLAHHWDLVHREQNRYSVEVASIIPYLKKQDAQTILDVGCGTGGHDIKLAREGYSVVGIERSVRMNERAVKKISKLPKKVQTRIQFEKDSDFSQLIVRMNKKYDSAMYMGNALSHNSASYKKDLKTVFDYLKLKGQLFLQIANAEKVLKTQSGFQDFNIAESKRSPGKRYAFLEFYEKTEQYDTDGLVMLNMVILSHDGKRWLSSAANNMQIATFDSGALRKLLEKIGFSNISFYGSNYGETLFTRPFDPARDDWFNVVAVKK